jgi:hypothetical protein
MQDRGVIEFPVHQQAHDQQSQDAAEKDDALDGFFLE